MSYLTSQVSKFLEGLPTRLLTQLQRELVTMSSYILDANASTFNRKRLKINLFSSSRDHSKHSNISHTPPPIAQPIESNLIWQWIIANPVTPIQRSES